MPTRMIREGLLDSQRYWSCTIEARELFIHLLLCADDFGVVSLAPVFIRRKCYDQAPPDKKIDVLLQQLFDNDLIRIYEIDGARYGFLPRYGQRLRAMRSKWPIPPKEIVKGDFDAEKKFSTIRRDEQKMPDKRQADACHLTARREEKGREEEVEVEWKRAAAHKIPRDWWRTDDGIMQKLTELNMKPLPGETYYAIKQRIFAKLGKD